MRRYTVLFAVVLTAILILSGLGLGKLSAQTTDHPIRLKTGSFYPTRGERPVLAPGLEISGYAAGQRGYYIIQFRGPVQEAWKSQVLLAGAELLEYIPDYAFKVRMSPAQADRVGRLQAVSWVGLFHPAYKLSPGLAASGVNLYGVRIERGADVASARAALQALGGKIVRGPAEQLVVQANAGQLNAIARITDVAWVQNFNFQEKYNEYGAGVISGAAAANASGYDGAGQVVAVADTGFGTGTAATAFADVPSSRITAIYDWTGADSGGCYDVIPDGPQDVDSGHGTHTAVSVLGDGGASGEGKGSAPGASLVFQAVEEYVDFYSLCAFQYPDGYYLMGIPADIQDLFSQAYAAGARVHSNSWGSPSEQGLYGDDAQNLDNFVWNTPDRVITFSTGNEGVDANNNGVVDSGSVTDPSTAKNAISVGASENDRQGNWDCDTGLSYTSCAAQGGQNSIFTYGSAWPSDFPVPPLSNDPSAGNAEQMAAFSSTGPVDDGRIKPDVVAPGTWVLSGYSDLYQQGYDGSANPQNGAWQYDGWGFPLNSTYKYMGGTSMSNPIVAGGAAVVRDFYQTDYAHNASAALVKATIINSAVDMLDENNDGANDNDFPIPNDHEGWGRMNLANATDDSHQWVDNTTGLNTGGSASYQYAVSGGSFKVTLVWSDYPSSLSASVNLVNDLDLVVTAPGGAQYKGNVFSGGWSQTGGSADRLNNVENVYIQSAAAGTWTVEVSGFNVPQGAQPFALVVDGTFGPIPTPSPTVVPSATPVPSSTPTAGPQAMHVDSIVMSVINAGQGRKAAQAVVTIVDGSGTPVSGATLVGTFTGDTNGSDNAVTNGSGQATLVSPSVKKGANWTFCVDNVTLSGWTYDSAANVETCDSTGTTSATATPTPDPNSTPVHVGDLDGSSVQNGGRWNATVTITVHNASEQPVSGATVSGSWSNGANGGGSCTTNGSGQCSITKNNVKNNVSSVTFTVTDISGTSMTYDSGASHDPEMDSDGTVIVIAHP